MKKLLIAVLTVFMLFLVVSCSNTNKSNKVKEAIAKAEKMTEKELAEAAKKEIGDNEFQIQSQSSGAAKALVGFKKKYNINYNKKDATSSKKDYQLYTALGVVQNGNHYTDYVLIQDARTLKSYVDSGILLNYVPKDIKLDEEDKQPLSAIYLNKLFLFNQKDTTFKIDNVWQLAGKKSDANHINKLSFQNPSTENINMNFLLQLTSPANIEMLAKAYKSFYGKEYVKEEQYENIALKFITEFLKNVSVWHTSDTTTVKDVISTDHANSERFIVYAPLAKYKDLIKQLNNNTELAAEILGWKKEITGFNGFLYKMYSSIPSTSNYPYTACLFARYLLTPEGFDAGWGGRYGYYSANSEAKLYKDDKPLSYWKKHCIIEDATHLSTIKNNTLEYIRSKTSSN